MAGCSTWSLAMADTSGIILDKSFVQGSKASDIAQLSAKGRGLMPDVLFFEMLSSDEPGRSRCFKKFPGENPVTIVPNVGTLLAYEVEHGRASDRPSLHALETRYQFNPLLAKGSYNLPPEATEVLERELNRVAEDVSTFIQLVNLAPLMFPDAFSGTYAFRQEARAEAERVLATDPEPIQRFYGELRDAEGRLAPIKAALNPTWAHFRWLQVRLVATLDLACRFGTVSETPSEKQRRKLEHFMLDIEYVILGALEGALAAGDGWMQDIWRRVCPDGLLVESHG